jgi:hypothetical protein
MSSWPRACRPLRPPPCPNPTLTLALAPALALSLTLNPNGARVQGLIDRSYDSSGTAAYDLYQQMSNGIRQ